MIFEVVLCIHKHMHFSNQCRNQCGFQEDLHTISLNGFFEDQCTSQILPYQHDCCVLCFDLHTVFIIIFITLVFIIILSNNIKSNSFFNYANQIILNHLTNLQRRKCNKVVYIHYLHFLVVLLFTIVVFVSIIMISINAIFLIRDNDSRG